MDIVQTIISTIQAIVKYAPQAVAAWNAIKEFIKALFGAGVISKEQQDMLFARVEAILAAFDEGQVPPSWAVDPDPKAAPDPIKPAATSSGRVLPKTR